MNIARRKDNRTLSASPATFDDRLAALRALDAQLLKTQIELEVARTAEPSSSPATRSDIEQTALLLLAGDVLEIAETDKARLSKIRVVRLAIARAAELANQHDFLAQVAHAQHERERRADEWRAAVRHRLMCVLALQAANRRCLELSREIKGKAHSISLPCEIAESPNILLGIGAVNDGPTTACLRDAVAAGIVTEAEISRAQKSLFEELQK